MALFFFIAPTSYVQFNDSGHYDYGKGRGATEREGWGASQVLSLRKGGKTFPPFKKNVGGGGGGGHNMFYPVLRRTGPQQVLDPFFVAPRKI